MTNTFDGGLASLLMTEDDWKTDEQSGAILLYGPFGGGKTHLALTASQVEELSPILVIDTEGSTTGVINKFDKSQIDVLRPRDAFYDPEDPESELSVYENTLNILKRIADGESDKYKTVIIDALDVFFNWGLAYYDVLYPTDGFAKWSMIHSDLTESPSSSHVGLMLRLKESGVLFIGVVHEKLIGDAEKGRTSFQWSGKGEGILGGIFDAVLHVSRKTNSTGTATTTVLTEGNGKNQSKNRYDLDWKLIDPTISDILGFDKA